MSFFDVTVTVQAKATYRFDELKACNRKQAEEIAVGRACERFADNLPNVEADVEQISKYEEKGIA